MMIGLYCSYINGMRIVIIRTLDYDVVYDPTTIFSVVKHLLWWPAREIIWKLLSY